MENRTCKTCGETLPLEAFKAHKYGRRHTCIECQRAYARDYNRRNAARYKAKKVCTECGAVRYTRQDAPDALCRACSALAASGAAWSTYHARRNHRLPVIHPNPDPVTHLPECHPVITPRRHPPIHASALANGPCHWCRESFTARVTSEVPRYCSNRCAKASAKARRGRFAVPPSVRFRIYERDRWICQLCLDSVDPDLDSSDLWGATLDHIVPRSHTLVPDDSPQNLQLAHRWCNSVKGDERSYDNEYLRPSA